MFSNLMIKMLPLVPQPVIRAIAMRYVAGEQAEDALRVALKLKKHGFVTTIDIFGEDVTSPAAAEKQADGYIDLMRKIDSVGAEKNISIKLSSLGLRLDQNHAFEQFTRVLEVAKEKGFFVRIDMEDSTVTDATLDFYRRGRKNWSHIGTVLQARLKRTVDDAKNFVKEQDCNFRLCKGAYPESPAIAYQNMDEIRGSYLKTLEILIKGGAYVGIATHDADLIRQVETLIGNNSWPTDRLEFQALLGVPVGSTLKRLRDRNYTVRLYLPFGKEWYAYSMRRVRENPQMVKTVVKGLFERDGLED